MCFNHVSKNGSRGFFVYQVISCICHWTISVQFCKCDPKTPLMKCMYLFCMQFECKCNWKCDTTAKFRSIFRGKWMCIYFWYIFSTFHFSDIVLAEKTSANICLLVHAFFLTAWITNQLKLLFVGLQVGGFWRET